MFDQPRRLDHGDHAVELYDSDEFLVECVENYVAAALANGDTAIVVATEDHRRAFADALAASGIDVAAAVESGRYIAVDARETLARFLVGDVPDPTRFRQVIGGLIAGAGLHRDVAVYGEMVALLWAEGRAGAAIALEDLWNDLAGALRFSLLCAYPMSAFERTGDAEQFRRMCEQHSSVIPAESYSGLTDQGEQHRLVAVLQQAARLAAVERASAEVDRYVLERELEEVREVARGGAPPAAPGDRAGRRRGAVDVETGGVTGFEALLRLDHPTRGPLVAGQFLEVAQDSGLMVPIGAVVVREACRQLARWQHAGAESPTISVNVSPVEVLRGGLVDLVLGSLQDAGADARGLCLEVPESLLMRATEETLDGFARLREAGVALALDDFGTGYASLTNLRAISVDALKIDGALTSQLGSPRETAVVEAITRLCGQLGVEVVAEGVETEDQLDWLRRLGCPRAQGNLFGPAMRPEAATSLLEASGARRDGGRAASAS